MRAEFFKTVHFVITGQDRLHSEAETFSYVLITIDFNYPDINWNIMTF